MKKWSKQSGMKRVVIAVVVAALVAGGVLLGIALAGGGGGGPRIVDNPTPSGLGQGPEIDWSNPASGVLVDSLEAAQTDLPFSAHVPKGLDSPRIYLRARNGEQPEDRVIAFVYQTPDGLVMVEEHLPYVSPAEYRRWQKAAVSPLKPGQVRYGHAKLVNVRGQDALLTYSEDATLLFWLEGGVEFILGGPNLPPDRAIALAESL